MLPQKFQPSLLDRAILAIAPTAGLKRIVAKDVAQRAYLSGASDSWRPRRATASANADHTADANALRAKSRFLIQNVDYIAAGMAARVSMVVGTGITTTFDGPDAAKVRALYQAWLPRAMANEVGHLYAGQADAFRAADSDGEVLIRIRRRRPRDGLTVPIQFQLMEVDYFDTQRQRNPDNGNDIINGKEYDQLGRFVGAWLFDQHPGEVGNIRRLKLRSKLVPAEDLIHFALPGRPGQARGFPRLSPCITRIRDVQLLEDAELQRKNQESRLSIITSLDPSLIENQVSADARAQGSLGELSSGGITSIPGGHNATVVAPAAAPGFVEYTKHNIKLICAGAGFMYEQATGDMTEVNFSSARVRRIEVRREVEQIQWLYFIPQVIARMDQEFLRAAELSANAGRPFRVTLDHSTPRWEYLNPKDEIESALDEIGGGLSSFSEHMRQRNDDPERRTKELAQDIQRFKDLGVWDDLLAMRHGPKSGSSSSAPAAQAPAQQKPST